jgi:hypothetical protein
MKPVFFCALLFLAYSCKKTTSPVHLGPKIASITPTTASPNYLDTIRGTGFSPDSTADTVKFNGIQAVVQSASDSTLVVLVPTGGASGPISVTTGSGTAAGPIFTYGPNIYVAGWENSVTGQFSSSQIAKYWKNGIGIPLTGDNGDAQANGICLTDTDVYLIGSSVTTSTYHAYYWNKEGYHQLIGGGYPAYGTALTLVDGEVYAAIDDWGTGGNSAILWENGVTDSLSNYYPYAIPNAIAVSGTDVYVGGSIRSLPAYWKNDSMVILSQHSYGGQEISNVTGIAMVGSDVYAVGTDDGSGNYAVLWKNGVETLLTDGTHNAAANAIQVVGADIYIAGYENNGSFNVAKYWKNGVPVTLSAGTSDGAANAIAVLGNDVYVAGHEAIGTVTVAKYWKNGVGVQLGAGGQIPSDGLGIAVQ